MRRAIAILLLVGLPRMAQAQLGFIDGIFKSVENVGAYFSTGTLSPHSNLAANRLRGFGVEVSFGIGGLGCVPTDKATCPRPAPPTRRLTDGEVTYPGKDSTVKYKEVLTPPPSPAHLISLSIAFGYTQLTGFQGRDTTADISGTVEEAPYIAAYASLYPSKAITPYAGVRAGLASLSGFRGYVNDTLYTAGGKTYLLGLVAGVAAGGDDAMVFAEVTQTYTNFPSVEWSAINNAVAIGLPRELRLTRRLYNFGIQVTFKK